MLPTGAQLARDQDGFTLIELMVALSTGMVVTLAAFAVLIISVHQSARVEHSTEANQSGRTTMTKIVDLLRSSCLATEFAPVQKESSSTKLIFINAASKVAVINEPEKAVVGTSSKEAFLNTITWSEVEKEKLKVPVLTLTRRASILGENQLPGEFSYTGTETSALLGELDLAPAKGKGESEPVFRYYKYSSTPNPGTAKTGANSFEEIPLVGSAKLTEANANEVAAVSVAFTALYRDGNTKLTQTSDVPFASKVALSIGLPNSESKVEDGPCQ